MNTPKITKLHPLNKRIVWIVNIPGELLLKKKKKRKKLRFYSTTAGEAGVIFAGLSGRVAPVPQDRVLSAHWDD